MNTLIRTIALIISFNIWLCSCNSRIVHQGNKDAMLKELDDMIISYVDSGFIGAVLIADPTGIIFNKAYNSKDSKIYPTTPFWIASNTKPITALAVLLLQEKNFLSTGDTISKFFDNVPNDKCKITIDQLLCHTSGLPDNFICEGEQDRESAINKIFSQELLALPGKEFNYTNDGYILLAAIIEKVTKMKYESFLRKVIFEKAGMGSTNFWGDRGTEVDQIHDSARYKPFYSRIFKDNEPLENWNNKGATGISSSSIDLYKMIAALKNGTILSKRSVDSLFYPRIAIDNIQDTVLSYGYGWAFLNYQNELIEIRSRGRSDWMHNNSIIILPAGFTIIAWSRDLGPYGNIWSTIICNKILDRIKKEEEE